MADSPNKNTPAASKMRDAASSARRTIETERAGLAALAEALDNGLAEPFEAAIRLLRAVRGRVVVSGVGKSGHIARKIASSLASTGTPALFVHPAEASHGDLGMVTADDAIIALSWSGEAAELRSLVEYSRRFRIPTIALTAAAESPLARASDVVLAMPRAQEACPHGLAPTTSTIMQLALGDALAIALLESRGFTAEDFRVLHPGGRLGANLQFVRNIMHTGDKVPLVSPDAPMSEAIVTISAHSFGCVGVCEADGKLVGVVTDGDLRRHMASDLLGRSVREVMTKSPRTIAPDTLVGEALATMNMSERPITVLFVVEEGRPVGIIHMHDLLRIGVA